MQLATAGAARVGSPDFDAIKYIEFHPSNILTSSSFTPPPRKSWIERLIEFLCRSTEP